LNDSRSLDAAGDELLLRAARLARSTPWFEGDDHR
jgi:hypothetical protein